MGRLLLSMIWFKKISPSILTLTCSIDKLRSSSKQMVLLLKVFGNVMGSFKRLNQNLDVIWVPLIGDCSLVCCWEDVSECDPHVFLILWGKQYHRICPKNYMWLFLEIFNIALDIHFCSSIGFTYQSRY